MRAQTIEKSNRRQKITVSYDKRHTPLTTHDIESHSIIQSRLRIHPPLIGVYLHIFEHEGIVADP